MRNAAFVFIILAFTLSSCIKPPAYSVVPQIAFVSASSYNATNGYRDTLTFSFTDGDGDIGIPSSNPADTVTNCTADSACALQHGDSLCLHQPNFNVFLIDSRDNCLESYASANVQPAGRYKALSGTIQVFEGMYNLRCSCPCSTPDTVVYGIILRDMAGHFSNVIHTTPITVGCN